MGIYKADDGREFYDKRRLNLYNKSVQAERSLSDLSQAPGGLAHEQAIKEHGPVRSYRYDAEGSGRHRLTFWHADGKTSTSVHPQAYRAHSLAAQALGIDNPPAAVETHQRSKEHPIGPKEHEAIRHNDHAAPEV